MKEQMISIVIPVYQVEKYLRKCVDSVLAQTYENIELILVDDGSPDGCGAICDEYAAKDSRVRVIHQTNAGVSAARNVGLAVAAGEYIGFVDSDDWIEPDMYEVLHELIERSGADISYADFCEDHEQSEGIPTRSGKICMMNRSEGMEQILRRKAHFGVWGKLVRRSLFEGITFPPDITVGEDFLVTVCLMGKADRVVHAEYGCYHYLQRDISASHVFCESYWTVLDAYDMVYDRVLESTPDVAKYMDAETLSRDVKLAIEADNNHCLTPEKYDRIRRQLRAHLNRDSRRLLDWNFRFWVAVFSCGRSAFTAVRKIRRTLGG